MRLVLFFTGSSTRATKGVGLVYRESNLSREAKDVRLHLVQHSFVVAVRDNVSPDVFPCRAKLLPRLPSSVVDCNNLHFLDGREGRARVMTIRRRLKTPVYSGEGYSQFIRQDSVPVGEADQSILSSK